MPNYKLKIGGRTLFLLPGQYEVGRMSDCWLTLDDDLVSRYHARFHLEGAVLSVEDLGSRNGTYVNGQQVEGRRELRDGDKVRIGREIMVVLGGADITSEEVDEEEVRRTLAPGEDTRFPTLISQLVEKSLKVGKLKEAERYALALTNQLMHSQVDAEHPTAKSCVTCLISLAERSSSGVWIDRVFRLYAVQRWPISPEILDAIRNALDRIPRIPGRGMRDYEEALVVMVREGKDVPKGLREDIAELADAYAQE